MNTEQERTDFEAWAKGHYILQRSAYNDTYIAVPTMRAWEVWQARAALQSQDREYADRYRWIRDEAGLMVLPYDDHGLGPEFPCGSDLDKAIDHARRAREDGK